MTMFKVPDWEVDVPKTNVEGNLLPEYKKTKEAKKNDLKQIDLISKGDQKVTLKKQITNHSFEKIQNRKPVANTPLKFTNNRASNKKHENNNIVKNRREIDKQTPKFKMSSINKETIKRGKLSRNKKIKLKNNVEFISTNFSDNKVSNHKQENNTLIDTKIKVEKIPMVYSKTSGMDIKNYDTDKLDEVILNAKKKKLVDSYKNEDNEETLFTENEDLSKEVKKCNKSKLKISVEMKTNEEEKTRNLLEQTIHSNNKCINNINRSSNNKKRKHNNLKDKEIINIDKDMKNNLNSESMLNLGTKKQQNNNKKLKLSIPNNKLDEENRDGVNLINHSKNQVNIKDNLRKQSLKTMFQRNHYNVKNSNKLRERMLEKLNAAKFRFLNEKLYTSSGSDAQKLFQEDPTAFQTYHQGYQQQMKKWPVKPLDVVVKRIKNMPKTYVIADMGCGEAALSQRVSQSVRSFDLVAAAPGVETCDIAHTPLLSDSVHVVVYCLALMGTDLTQYLVEANRVLKTGGHLLIAEVESRFDKVDEFVAQVHRLGFTLKKLDKSHQVFYFMEFTKERGAPVKKAKLPTLYLKPCIYKKR